MDEFIVFNKPRQVVKVNIKTVNFIEKKDRKVFIRTDSETLDKYGKIEYFSQNLGPNFLTCRRGLIINMDNVKSIRNEWVEFMNGEKIPLCRDKFTDATRNFAKYLCESGRMEKQQGETKE